MKIVVDKIASVTKNVPLTNKVEITSKIVCEEGAVIAVEVLKDKKIYNQLELTTGRLSTIHKGDILVVALGNRRALKGFVGEVPKKLKVNDIINILNLGGVAGICTSANIHEVGLPLKAKVLGAVCDKNKKPINIKAYKLFAKADKIKSKIPLIVISGTCMSVGKTTVACEIVKGASKEGYKIFCAKLAGIAALRDTANMQDYGAHQTVSMIDAGYTSTAIDPEQSVEITKGAINYLSKEKPDYIVIELGDGIIGEYGVMEILRDSEFRKNITFHVGCAHDPVGALKLYEICKELKVPLHLISGPVTDNSIGTQFIAKHLSIPAINGLTNGKKLFPKLLENKIR